jgi:hypothetical protein
MTNRERFMMPSTMAMRSIMLSTLVDSLARPYWESTNCCGGPSMIKAVA